MDWPGHSAEHRDVFSIFVAAHSIPAKFSQFASLNKIFLSVSSAQQPGCWTPTVFCWLTGPSPVMGGAQGGGTTPSHPRLVVQEMCMIAHKPHTGPQQV